MAEKLLRIIISSPGDVAEERDKAKQVIAALQRHYGDAVSLMLVLWEALAIPATASFQEGIDFVLAERHRVDIAVFILWSRLGSPLGVAIQKPDGSAYRSGTEREFDVMLAAFEQSGGKVPIILAYTRSDDEGFNSRLDARQHGDDALGELLSQRKLVKQFIRENFQDNEGRNLRAYHSYREPVGFAQRLHVHLRGAVDELLGLDTTAATWTEDPYRSLEVFDIRHAPIFCGRDEETCELLQRLRDQQGTGCAFVCIVGASGSGKSSLARAGVAATLMQRSFDEGVKEWRVAVFIPGHAQGDLCLALARALAEPLPELREGVGGLEKITKCFEAQNHEAAGILIETAFNTAAGKLGGPLRLLLVLDQMEELWTDRSITPEQREKFLQTIEAIAHSGHITVLATLRSDFYTQAQLSETFLRMKGERGHFDLTPPGTAALQQLIVQPAHRAGLSFERDAATGSTLDQRILEDAARDPSALPLLQYALAELYERRDEKQRLLAFAAYEAMGGVEGALGKRAAQTFDNLPAEAQAAFDELLPLLISVDIAGEQNAVRRRASLADLTSTPARRCLTEALIDKKARFLTTDEQSGTPIATLAHEALLRRWDRITTWINTNRDLLRMRARIEQYQAMWEESGHDATRLLPAGLPLEEGRKLMEATAQLLDEKAKHFVLASSAHHEEQHRRVTRRGRVAFAVLSTLTMLALVGGGLAIAARKDETRQRIEAVQQRAEAERQRARAKEGESNALVSKAETERLKRLSEGLVSLLTLTESEVKSALTQAGFDGLSRSFTARLEDFRAAYGVAGTLAGRGDTEMVALVDRAHSLQSEGQLAGAIIVATAVRNGIEAQKTKIAREDMQLLEGRADMIIGMSLQDEAFFQEALNTFDQAKHSFQSIATKQPTDSSVALLLAEVTTRIGDVYHMRGSYPEALRSYREALAQSEKQASQYRDSELWQMRLAESHLHVGHITGIYLADHDLLAETKMHFDACLTIANFKLGTDPNNIRALTLAVGVQGGYAVILNYEKSPEAVRYAADAADLLGRLSELQPKDTAAKREHAVALWRSAGLLMAARPPEFKRSLIANSGASIISLVCGAREEDSYHFHPFRRRRADFWLRHSGCLQQAIF